MTKSLTETPTAEKSVKVEQKEPVILNPTEEQYIKLLRLKNEKRQDCAKEIDAILKSYGASLSINPEAPFNKPEIIVVIH